MSFSAVGEDVRLDGGEGGGEDGRPECEAGHEQPG